MTPSRKEHVCLTGAFSTFLVLLAFVVVYLCGEQIADALVFLFAGVTR